MSFKYSTDTDIDSVDQTIFHRKILKDKKLLNELYRRWYKYFLKEIEKKQDGKFVEIGSGGGFLKELAPQVICSDIQDLPDNDMTFSATDMPFENESIDGIFMINTFHHIPNSRNFLNEVSRVLKKGGLVLMVEPASTLFGKFVYRNFHQEPFDTEGTWEIDSTGPLSGANGALPWIVFTRDNQLFNKEYPNLDLAKIEYITPFSYLISGGFSFKNIFPNFLNGLFFGLDKLIAAISKQACLFQVIKLTKK